jgi:hypothetical protein
VRRGVGRRGKGGIGDLERGRRRVMMNVSAFDEMISGDLDKLLRGRSSTGTKNG